MCSKHKRWGPSSLWKLAAACFIRVLNVGLPLARRYPQYFEDFWTILGVLLEEFLFAE